MWSAHMAQKRSIDKSADKMVSLSGAGILVGTDQSLLLDDVRVLVPSVPCYF
jgi:hypothetical protein